jgi:hypothetical protein
MNPLKHPVSILLGLATVASAILPLPAAWKLPLVILGAIAWVGSIAFMSMARQRPTSDSPHPAELSADSRMLIRPLVQLRDELATIVAQNSDMPSVKVVGTEALAEADGIVRHATSLVQIRTQLKRTLRGKSEAEVETRNLETKLERATTDTEREALQTAIAAHQQEAEHYKGVEDAIASVDGKLTEAQAALSELKSRIAVGAAGARTDGIDQEELTDMVGRLRSLSKSFDEAESTLQEHVR